MSKNGKENKARKTIKVLTQTEIAIYELFTGDTIDLTKESDHKHKHYYWIINSEGSGRWRKYDHIIRFILIKVRKLVESTKIPPHKTNNWIDKTRPVSLTLTERQILNVYRYAYKHKLTLSKSIGEMVDKGYKTIQKRQLDEWLKKHKI